MKTIYRYPTRSISLTIIVVALLAFGTTFGQDKADQIDKLMKTYHVYDQFNGSILVADKGDVIYSRGLGLANMEWDIPNASDTKHRLGSITKQFTAALILQFVEQGKLDLNAPITKYLKNYPKAQGDKITIHHLLTHSAGIPNYTSLETFQDIYRNPYTPKEFLTVFQDSVLQFNPGEKFAYSNSGYFLLGVILEEVSGKAYETLLHQNILNPLNMTATGYDHHDRILKNRATGYDREGKKYTNSKYLDMSLPYAAGSMYSTVEDLYTWDRALYTNKVLTQKSRDLMFTAYMPTGRASYGYGWSIGKEKVANRDSITVVEHGGGINGFNTLIYRIPEDNHAIILLNNTGRIELFDMAKELTKILYDQPFEMPKQSLALAVMESIKSQNIEKGMKTFETHQNNKDYNLNENEMNRVGYYFLQNSKTKEAIEVFKMNVVAFPESSNVYDSLGEAYFMDKQNELALKNYKKSLELNPENENAEKFIEKIKNQ
ncbi:serine hydrolase [Aquimarina sp. 2-A2]|uniref:serine hydrolase n=1 Tax=Aquimarina sp. 2-A2 TaxID=3382644 RepID=UPI00387F2A6E